MFNRKRDVQAKRLTGNWSIWKRLPRLTAYAVKFGYIDAADFALYNKGIEAFWPAVSGHPYTEPAINT